MDNQKEIIFVDTRFVEPSDPEYTEAEEKFYYVCCWLKQRIFGVIGLLAVVLLYCSNLMYDPIIHGKNFVIALVAVPICLVWIFAPVFVQIRFLPVLRWYKNLEKV